MHLRLRELASPFNPPLYPNIDISDDILSQYLVSQNTYNLNTFHHTMLHVMLRTVIHAIIARYK